MCCVCLKEVVIFRFGWLFQLDETSSVMSAGDVMQAIVIPLHKTYYCSNLAVGNEPSVLCPYQ